MKNIRRIISLCLVTLLVSSASLTAFAESPSETASRYIKAIIEKIYEDYRFDANKDGLYEAAIDYLIKENPYLLEGTIDAVTGVLDKHSEYFTREEMKSFMNFVEQAYVGIGVTILETETGIKVTEVNAVGGAYAAGILAGDVIIEVSGENVLGKSLDEVTEMVRGDEGTYVKIKVLRGDNALEFDVERRRIYTETVYFSIDEEDKIAYIYITEFAPSTPSSMEDALAHIESKGIKKFIIDVRSNPGGELESVSEVLSMFVPKNKVLTKIEYNDEKRNEKILSTAKFTSKPNRKIIVLANGESASAAELFAGALQNLKLAKVVGETTYGKGSMQQFLGLNSNKNFTLGDIKLSVAEFTKPDGTKINGIGIEPDVKVKNGYESFDASSLTQMTISARYTVGDVAEDVRAIEERLSALGYFKGEADDVFDENTKTATEKFQSDTGLFVYGVMDYTTQSVLNEKIDSLEVPVDRQFNKAYEMLLKE